MFVSTIDRGRDALNARPHDTEKRSFSMQPQLTTSPLFGDPRLPARFWVKVSLSLSGCWVWNASRDRRGYGRFKIDGRARLAHRVAFQHLIGPIPDGLEPDHLCRNHACVNPACLELVAHRENVLRGGGLTALHARKTHCPQGHPYDEANTYTSPGRCHRKCRICQSAAIQRFYQRKRR